MRVLSRLDRRRDVKDVLNCWCALPFMTWFLKLKCERVERNCDLSRHLLSVATWKWPCNGYLFRQEVGWVAQNRSVLFPPLERTDRTPVVWSISLQYLYPPERDIAVGTHHALLRHRRLFTFGQTAWNERVTVYVFHSHILSLKRLVTDFYEIWHRGGDSVNVAEWIYLC